MLLELTQSIVIRIVRIVHVGSPSLKQKSHARALLGD